MGITADSNKENKNNYIVGIGASAGGLEAIQKLLTDLPANTNCSFIIVQHLSPDYKSLLCEILSRHTVMPVIEAEEGMIVEPNHVYIIQPRKNMKILKGRLRLSAHREHELNFPIDFFFRSLAEEAGNNAIAIILSGTGSDGSQGIVTVKENGGLILVQDDTAKFDGMPKNAMRTGVVDAQMPPEMMAAEIVHISTSAYRLNTNLARFEETEVDDELFKKVYVVLQKACNVNFSHYKRATITRRMSCRMSLTRKNNLEEYVEYLYGNPYEAKILSKEILIGVTSFFRDPEYLQELKEKAINEIITNSSSRVPVRVWVAGCSTGEEAYSLAILFSEAMDELKITRTIKIFATDLDAESIEIASKGIYRDSIIDSVSAERLSRYFTLSNGNYTVKHELRSMIIFSQHNVFQDPPFGKLDLISCRNMMIYFQPVLQNELFNTFHIALKDQGFLFLGKSESVGAFTAAFPAVNTTAKIFKHKGNVKYPNTKKVSFLQMSYMDENLVDPTLGDLKGVEDPFELGIKNGENDVATNRVLEQFLPACILVDTRNRIKHTYGDCSNVVHIASGVFTNSLFDIITEGLKIAVSTILKEAKELKEKVQYTDVSFKGENKDETICLTATPIKNKKSGEEELYALIFLTNNSEKIEGKAIPYEIDNVAAQRITDLEQYLDETQDKLNKSIAELECVNEELQAANEELLTANEELQSSNEELQSVNEELYTVNSEYQQKLTELSELNDDITNFLSSRLIGIIFVDRDLNIRRFTDYVSTEFSIMTHDVGRPITCISYHFPAVDIPAICTNVLTTLVPVDKEIVNNAGVVYTLRVEPYYSAEHTIDGCVITFMDGTTLAEDIPSITSIGGQAVATGNTKDRLTANALMQRLDQILKNEESLLENKDKDVNVVEMLDNLHQLKQMVSTITKPAE